MYVVKVNETGEIIKANDVEALVLALTPLKKARGEKFGNGSNSAWARKFVERGYVTVIDAPKWLKAVKCEVEVEVIETVEAPAAETSAPSNKGMTEEQVADANQREADYAVGKFGFKHRLVEEKVAPQPRKEAQQPVHGCKTIEEWARSIGYTDYADIKLLAQIAPELYARRYNAMVN